ncbi:hypothetical protein CAPTEDRAFT_203022 [Capitella teleta]|uniref:Uncharacterized protein n=1 Tax=Capitella teleta TaxID=283909 RepID=R7TNL2_CAPTE|nr:hypothetical protein CAPTEDRAFT_203022 [Capitella teleta]|eukprot:ELT95132.1 hypothetical protein CAPTEDRAFT_203022 [Capitella teleta]
MGCSSPGVDPNSHPKHALKSMVRTLLCKSIAAQYCPYLIWRTKCANARTCVFEESHVFGFSCTIVDDQILRRGRKSTIFISNRSSLLDDEARFAIICEGVTVLPDIPILEALAGLISILLKVNPEEGSKIAFAQKKRRITSMRPKLQVLVTNFGITSMHPKLQVLVTNFGITSMHPKLQVLVTNFGITSMHPKLQVLVTNFGITSMHPKLQVLVTNFGITSMQKKQLS